MLTACDTMDVPELYRSFSAFEDGYNVHVSPAPIDATSVRLVVLHVASGEVHMDLVVEDLAEAFLMAGSFLARQRL